MSRNMLTTTLLAALACATVLTAGDLRWINVHVDETGEGTKVEIHLPLTLIDAAIGSVRTREFHDGLVQLDLEDMEIDLKRLMQEIQAAPDGDYVKVKDTDADVVVTKKAGTILIDVQEHGKNGDRVHIKIPARILDSIHVTDKNELDVRGLINALGAMKAGDLVRVESSDANVRVWIE